MEKARLYAELIMSNSANKTEALRLCGLVMAELAIIDCGGIVGVSRGYSQPDVKGPVEQTSKPTLPIPVSKPSGRVIAPVGVQCYCDACKEFKYQVVKPIYEMGMTNEDFLGSYLALGDSRPMDDSMLEAVLCGDDGSYKIDCTCGGIKSLTIIPASKKEQVSTAPVSSGSVTSIKPGQF